MLGVIVTVLVGAVCIILGISNMRGNISSLHSYHRHRVSEEDRLPFGRLVGLGTIIAGASIIVYSAFMAIALYIQQDIYTLVGTAIMILGLAVGITIAFYAMKKYNGGIF
ncbi:MAG: hypothetical protein J6V80_03570 [Clostridia bacterium]|nr:hypothetical protein [Clostridia bacterium]